MDRKPAPPRLTVRAIRCVGVEVPMTYALGTSRGIITKAPLLLIDLDTEEGVIGRSYLWCYFPAADRRDRQAPGGGGSASSKANALRPPTSGASSTNASL